MINENTKQLRNRYHGALLGLAAGDALGTTLCQRPLPFKNAYPRDDFGRKDFLPVKPQGTLLPHSPKRTQVRLKSLLYLVWLTPDPLRTHGRPSGQECRVRLKRPSPNAARRCPPTSEVFRQVE